MSSFVPFLILGSIVVVSSDIVCDSDYSCRSKNYTCDDPTPCTITCSGRSSCQDSRFTCPNGCNVKCEVEQSCADSTYFFEAGVVSMDCRGQDACVDVTIYVNNDTHLDINCDGYHTCEDGIINCYDESTFSVSCEGPGSCGVLRCVCDGSECETSGNLQCSNTEYGNKSGKKDGGYQRNNKHHGEFADNFMRSRLQGIKNKMIVNKHKK